MDNADAFEGLLNNLDISVFRSHSSTSPDDKKSLLAVQNVARNLVPHYVYFEIGSHLGGSLVPHLLDPRCRHIFSVDKRPTSQPDERGKSYEYKGNSTQRMLGVLQSHVPPAALLKLTTLDADASDLMPDAIPLKVDLAFIDGEHTNVATFRDFIATKQFLKESCIVAFHDANLVSDALLNIECFLQHTGATFRLFFLPTTVAVIVFGDYVEIVAQPLARIGVDRKIFIDRSRANLLRAIVANNPGSPLPASVATNPSI